MATTTGSFPLATESPYTGPPTEGTGDDAGASGPSSYGTEISHGAMIAIIVVVCVVGVLGSKLPSYERGAETASLKAY